MVGSGLMPFQRAKSSNPLSLFGDKIGRWMGKVLPPILPAPGALPAGSGKRLPGSDGRVNLPLFHHPPVRAPLIKVNSSTY